MTRPRKTGGPGRPRDSAADQAIFDAVVALLCEQGFDAVTVESVAARAGVSRPTVYRRHRDRRSLAHAAIRDAIDRLVPQPRTATDPRDRVLSLLENTVAMLTATAIGPVFRAMIPHLPHDPTLGALANELGRARRATLRAAVVEARACGALPAARDLDAVLDGLLGAIYFRFLITQRSLDAGYLNRLLDALGDAG